MIQEHLTERRRCAAKNRNGARCNTFALKGEDKCIWHSSSGKAKKSKNKPFAIKSNQDLILILQKELNRIRKKSTKGNVLKRAGEIRQLVQLISELKGKGKKNPVDGGNQNQPDSFEQKVKRAKKRKNGKR